jgi:hypothetical protein
MEKDSAIVTENKSHKLKEKDVVLRRGGEGDFDGDRTRGSETGIHGVGRISVRH